MLEPVRPGWSHVVGDTTCRGTTRGDPNGHRRRRTPTWPATHSRPMVGRRYIHLAPGGEHMTQDWPAVAEAIKDRLQALGMNQAELAEISGVSSGTISELRNGTIRRREPRILNSLSTSLNWPEPHLAEVLAGRRSITNEEQTAARLQRLEELIAELDKQVHRLGGIVEWVDHWRLRITAWSQRITAMVQPGRTRPAADHERWTAVTGRHAR
ncbi:XRE family transcriptional regulator [Pseudonocardiaceae bacterium YIM PH 21723]|nr:XRE family transcriptional regulator [Pseudonocardiaceae bacterium YIM PH 21723]